MATKIEGSSTEEEISEAGEENQSQNIKSAVAIQCAQSAMLLTSLKQHDHSSSDNSILLTVTDDVEEQGVIEELMKEVVKARWKNKKIRTCGFYEFCLQIAILFSLWTLCFLIAADFLH